MSQFAHDAWDSAEVMKLASGPGGTSFEKTCLCIELDPLVANPRCAVKGLSDILKANAIALLTTVFKVGVLGVKGVARD